MFQNGAQSGVCGKVALFKNLFDDLLGPGRAREKTLAE